MPAAGLLLHLRQRPEPDGLPAPSTFDGEGVKADVDFGPTLMLNRNRCIMCTRCARFMREVDGDAQIGIVDRGHGSEITTFNEQGAHSLLSGNLMDVCPVGAITTRQYRFRSRPWDNPNAIDTDLHGLLEGLQHHGLAEGQARVGQGLAAGAEYAALPPRGQRLLDVRASAAIPTAGSKAIRGWRKPQVRGRDGIAKVAAWRDALLAVRDLLNAAGRRDPAVGAPSWCRPTPA